MLVAGHPRVAQRPEEDRVVVVGEGRELLVGDGHAPLEVAVGAEIPLHELDVEVVHLGGPAEDPRGLRGDLRTDPVAGDEGDA